jgi:hypothetical protein
LGAQIEKANILPTAQLRRTDHEMVHHPIRWPKTPHDLSMITMKRGSYVASASAKAGPSGASALSSDFHLCPSLMLLLIILAREKRYQVAAKLDAQVFPKSFPALFPLSSTWPKDCLIKLVFRWPLI